MRRHTTAAVGVFLAAFASACSSEDRPEAAATSTSPSTSASPTKAPAKCQELSAKVPTDLTNRRLHVAKGMGKPASVGVIWSNSSESRVVNVSSARSDEEFGEGAAGIQKKRTVQGVTATETVNGDIHRIAWQQPGDTGPCAYWTVVTQGLKPGELGQVLNSVSEKP